jgi:magnesium-transporting ATPase (P-type)
MELAAARQEVEAPHRRETNGLTSAEVLKRRQECGENVLPAEKGPSAWVILFNQLKSPLVYIILAAAGVSLVVGEYGDFCLIMAVVVIDAILGFSGIPGAAHLHRAQRSAQAGHDRDPRRSASGN